MSGAIWGLSSALLEETVVDIASARYVNNNLADYLVPVNADVPSVEIIMVAENDERVNPLGIKGIGEIGIVGMNAAVANAVFHATASASATCPSGRKAAVTAATPEFRERLRLLLCIICTLVPYAHFARGNAMVQVERVQTGIRIEKRLLKVLKALAELKDLSVGDLLEGIVLHAFEGKTRIFQGDPGADRRTEKNLPFDASRRRQPSIEGADLEQPRRCCIRASNFRLTANAPFDVAWPLFGADKERVWAPDWEPVFLWPEKPFDQEGMVFRVRARRQDRGLGQHRIRPFGTADSIRLCDSGCGGHGDHARAHAGIAARRNVDVVYERTALAERQMKLVRDMAARDRVAGTEWSQQINGYLGQ